MTMPAVKIGMIHAKTVADQLPKLALWGVPLAIGG